MEAKRTVSQEDYGKEEHVMTFSILTRAREPAANWKLICVEILFGINLREILFGSHHGFCLLLTLTVMATIDQSITNNNVCLVISFT